ncbi:hypothetical protein CWO89_20110 [Bradyrhizobium sp. Leo170]|nr:hypothetical protein CWO89_20110 [Bradyrhizobium sp. Leo170]
MLLALEVAATGRAAADRDEAARTTSPSRAPVFAGAAAEQLYGRPVPFSGSDADENAYSDAAVGSVPSQMAAERAAP